HRQFEAGGASFEAGSTRAGGPYGASPVGGGPGCVPNRGGKAGGGPWKRTEPIAAVLTALVSPKERCGEAWSAQKPYKGTGARIARADRRRSANGIQQRADAAANRSNRPIGGAGGCRAQTHAGAPRRAGGRRNGAGIRNGAVGRYR